MVYGPVIYVRCTTLLLCVCLFAGVGVMRCECDKPSMITNITNKQYNTLLPPSLPAYFCNIVIQSLRKRINVRQQ